jgi:hypothetical protein
MSLGDANETSLFYEVNGDGYALQVNELTLEFLNE